MTRQLGSSGSMQGSWDCERRCWIWWAVASASAQSWVSLRGDCSTSRSSCNCSVVDIFKLEFAHNWPSACIKIWESRNKSQLHKTFRGPVRFEKGAARYFQTIVHSASTPKHGAKHEDRRVKKLSINRNNGWHVFKLSVVSLLQRSDGKAGSSARVGCVSLTK